VVFIYTIPLIFNLAVFLVWKVAAIYIYKVVVIYTGQNGNGKPRGGTNSKEVAGNICMDPNSFDPTGREIAPANRYLRQ
jgi:hypothetical protein